VNPARAYVAEIKYEFLKTIRLPGYVIPTILFPLMFYILFGLALGPKAGGGVEAATYLIATYGAFGVIGASLVGFGVSVATERGQGWLLVKRASPMPPMAYFIAKIAMSMLFSLVLVILLLTLGTSFGGVELPVSTMLALTGTLVAGALPFCAMGLAIGYLAGPNSASAIVNLIYLPMSFASGLWIPMEILPKFFKVLGPMLPAYHFAQLGLASLGYGQGSALIHLLVLGGYALIFLAIALFAYRRDEGRTFG